MDWLVRHETDRRTAGITANTMAHGLFMGVYSDAFLRRGPVWKK